MRPPTRPVVRTPIVEELILLRRQHGYTQRQLAELLGTRQSTVSAHENGRLSPNLNTLIKWAAVFGRNVGLVNSFGED